MGVSSLKVVVSKHVVEVYSFQSPVVFGDDVKKNKGRALAAEGESERYVEHRLFSSKKAKQTVRRLVLQNFDSGSKFITLTFKDGSVDDVRNLDSCYREFDKFIKRLKRFLGPSVPLKWLAVVEFQDGRGRGAIHYHMISDLPYIPAKKLEELWRCGFVRINKIEHVDNVGAYVCKYMLKNVDDPRLQGRKCYFRSMGLAESTVLYGKDAEAYLEGYAVMDKKEVFTSEYHSEHHGQISYVEYNLLRG